MIDALNNAISEVFNQRLRNRKQRELVVATLMTGFSRLAKKPVDDLPGRTQEIEEKARKMSENIHLGFAHGRCVVKVVGSSESFLTELRHGTNWYEPWEKVDEIVLAAILVDPSK